MSCVRLTSGSLSCWGFGDGRFSGYTSVTQATWVSAGQSGCSVDITSAITCFGSYIPQPPPSAAHGLFVSAGDRHACSVADSGVVTCWGTNDVGQSSPPANLRISSRPSFASVSPADSMVSLRWTPVGTYSGNAVTGYTVAASPGGVVCATVVGVDSDPLACDVTGLSNGTAYSFTVIAVTNLGSTPPSAPAIATPRTVPGAPSDVSAVAMNASASVSWSAPASDGGSAVTGYTSAASPGGATCSTSVGIDLDPLSCDVTGLSNGISYSFTVVAHNAAGDSDLGGPSASVMPKTVPSAPRSVFGVPGNGQVSLSWLAPLTLNGSSLLGYRATAAPGGGTCSTLVSDVNPLSCVVSGLTNGSLYSFRVVALVDGAQSASSASSSGTPRTVPGAPSGVSGAPGSGSATVSWVAPVSNGGSPINSYVLAVSPVAGSCVVTGVSASCTGLTNGTAYSFTVIARNAAGDSVPSGASVPVVPRTVPGAPRNVTGAAEDESSIAVYWDAPVSDGGSAVTGYSVTAAPDGATCYTASSDVNPLSCVVTGLSKGSSYSFTVRASNVAGQGGASAVSSPVLVTAVPDAPSGVASGVRTYSSVGVSWNEPASFGLPVTGYKLRFSSDAGLSWPSSVDVTGRSFTLSGLPLGVARLVQVAGVNARGQGPWSDSWMLTTKGAKPVRVLVKTASGQPVSGGAITWEMVPRTVWSSIAYGLTSDGVIDFPAAPAGTVKVTLTGGQMPDGTLVTGTWTSALGFDSAVLRVPNIAPGVHRVHVTLPGGLPVSNVRVSVPGLRDSRTYQGFRFVTPAGADTGFTDASGLFSATGFTSGSVDATVTYNDGVLGQEQVVDVSSSDSYVELEYAPFVQADTSTGTAAAGSAVSVTLTAKAAGTGVLSMSGLRPLAGQPGVGVSLVLPAGAVKGTCGAKLSGTTNASGKVTLKVCATKSGLVRVRTTGAVPVGGFTILVKGRPSLPPRSLTALSKSAGSVSLSWAKPFFTGGATVTSYRAVFAATGKATVTRTLTVRTGTSLVMRVAGLAHATKYTVKLSAITKYGVSDPTVTTVPVA